jgi:hypothetical protein
MNKVFIILATLGLNQCKDKTMQKIRNEIRKNMAWLSNIVK